MFFVYILYSPSGDKFYKGQTRNLDERVGRHNSGQEKATQHARPWKLMWATNKKSRSAAVVFENKLKNLGRRKLLQLMLDYQDGVAGPDALRQIQTLKDAGKS